jgi:hypothetical protein
MIQRQQQRGKCREIPERSAKPKLREISVEVDHGSGSQT